MLTIEAAKEQQAQYQANERTRGELADTSLVAFIGGTAVGKNFLMQESGLFVCGTETSRAPRGSDDPDKYTYSSNETLLTAIENRELVQYGVHLPDTIYASRLSDYKLGEPNATDIWFDAMEPLKNKGFKAVQAISVLAPADQWVEQLTERFHDRSVGYAYDRLTEARHSLRWSLAHHLSHTAHHLIVLNSRDQTTENIARIHQFANGEIVPPLDDILVNETAKNMFKTIDHYLAKLS